MKYQLFFLLFVFCAPLLSQNLQLHYDFRHSVDAKRNTKNFPTLFFEHFKGKDSGSFLLKMQTDLMGEKNNIGKFYMQVSQSLRFWKPKVYLTTQYSGGLGIAEPGRYGFYISNAFSLGAAYPFQWKNAWFSTSISYSYNVLQKTSHDLLYSFYWGKGFWNYKIEFVGDFEIWTQNKNRGDAYTKGLQGKRLSFFGEPQIWFNLNKSFSIGAKINLYYHVLTLDDVLQIYPTIAVKYKP